MLKKYLNHFAKFIGLVLVIGAVFFFWLTGFVPTSDEINSLKLSQKSDLPYLQKAPPQTRGRILALVSSHRKIGGSKKKTGYELTELSRAYWVFTANGFEVDVASPQGGEPRKVLDGDDMGAYDYAFLNDAITQEKIQNTLKIEDINTDDYDAIYIVGGKGAMFDLPNNIAVQNTIKTMHQSDKIIAAVCHGPAALINVKLDNGDWLVNHANVSAFTNEEELFLIPDAKKIFPFLLQDKLIQRGAKFNAGKTYLEQISINDNLITGQNPWSVWSMSEEIIKALGYTPVERAITAEEHSVNLLLTYEKQGYNKARESALRDNKEYQHMLILMHSMISLVKMDLGKSMDLLFLANTVKNNTAS